MYVYNICAYMHACMIRHLCHTAVSMLPCDTLFFDPIV